MFDRLRTEVQNAVLRADTLKEKRPNESIEILDRMMANLENSSFEADQVAPMVRQLRRSRTSVDSYMAQRAPIIELQRRNEEVKNHKHNFNSTHHDQVRCDALFIEWHINLRNYQTTDSLLSMTRGKLITQLRSTNLSHHDFDAINRILKKKRLKKLLKICQIMIVV